MAGILEILESSEDFKAVITLRNYLQTAIGLENPEVSHLSEFLDSTVVCLLSSYKFPSVNSTEALVPHCHLVDEVIGKHIKASSNTGLRLEEPVQTLGYTKYGSGALRKNPSLTLALKSPNWEQLHDVIGSELMEHIVSGKDLAVLLKLNGSYVQVIGFSLAKYLKSKPHLTTVKTFKPSTFKEVKAYKKDYSQKLKADKHKKPDVLAKLPYINRVRMLYCPLIRDKNWFSSKHPLYLAPEEAGYAIATQILGKRSKGKYLLSLTKFFTKFSRNLKNTKLSAHLSQHCPLPKGFKNNFSENLNQNYSFEWLFEQNTSWQEVCSFLVMLLKKVVPKELLGSKQNIKALQSSAVKFLKLGTWERVSCSALCVGYKFSHFSWIKEFSDQPRRLLVGKILHWIFNDFVVPIMQNAFYITEKQHENSVLYFYRKPIWSVIQHFSKQKLQETQFFSQVKPREARKCQDYTQFPPAKLRVQPKPEDFRPIMHFKSRIQVSPQLKLSGNNLVAGIPQILKSCLETGREVLCLDYPSVVEKIRNFSQKWEQQGKPEMFFMTMDIAKAFDSVKLQRLREFIKNLRIPVISTYYKYIQLLPRFTHPPKGPLASMLKMKFKKLTLDEGSYPLFTDLDFAGNSINIPTSKSLINTSDKIQMIEKIIHGNIIKFNRQYFIGEKGVPQGLPVSPLLSNLYFSEFEEEIIAGIRKEYPDNLLCALRLHDDYLVLSDSEGLIEELFTRLHQKGKQENFGFKQEKITSNIQAPWVSHKENSIEGWVGLNITKNLEVIPHVPENAPRTVSFDFTSNKATSADLKNKLVKLLNISINLLRNRSSASEDVLEEALAKLMNLQAMRYLGFLKTIRKFYRQPHSAKHISRLVVKVLRHSSQLVPQVGNFFLISLKEFAKAFKNSSLHSVHCRLKAYIAKLP